MTALDTDRDPELHSFDVMPVSDSNLVRRGEHILKVTQPSFGDERWVSSSLFGFNRVELVDLRDTIDRYLEETDG